MSTSAELYTKVFNMGKGAIARPLPRGLLQTFMDGIEATYEGAGLDPADAVKHRKGELPTMNDRDGSVQTWIQNGLHPYRTGRFVAESINGLFIVEGKIVTCDGSYAGSLVVARSNNVQGREEAPFTKGPDGSVQLAAQFFTEHAAEFKPEAPKMYVA